MFHRQPVALYCLCMGVGLIGVLGSMLPLLSDAEESLGLHMLYTLRGPEKTPTDVVVVAIDSESAAALNLPLNPHQWPRLLHSQLIEALTACHAAVIVFDLFFQESRATNNDKILATAMRDAGNVVLTQAIDRQTMSIPGRGGNRSTQVTIERVISASSIFADAAIAQAPFPLPKVPIKLNQFWCFRSESGNQPTLPVVAFHIYAKDAFFDFIQLLAEIDAHLVDTLDIDIEESLDVRSIVHLIRPLRMRFEENTKLVSNALERLGNYPKGKISSRKMSLIRSLLKLYGSGNSRYLNFYGPPGSIRTISYHRLVEAFTSFQPDKNKEYFKDVAVFVGQTDSNWIKTHDGFYTAFSGASGQDISGVEVAATAFSNLLEVKGVYALKPVYTLLLLTGWAILVVSVCLYLPTSFSVMGLLILNGIYFYVAFVQFKSNGVWFPLVIPIIVQTPTAFVTSLLYKYRKATIERKNIREAFGRYLPDDVVDRLSANLKSLNLGGQVFYGVCLFTDAQNYTTLSESMDPGSLTDLMNAYYKTVFGPIKANGGLVLQVVGDSVMALWTASEPNCEIKHAACMAAVEITAAVDRFNRQVGSCAMPTRIGIHAGDMLLGNIGAMDHFEYRPVGDIVNTASRLEGLNKFLGTHVLVSHDAISPDNGFLERSVGRFVFKGKSQPVHVHELVERRQPDENEKTAVCRLFASGLDSFQNGHWDEAIHWFDQILLIDPADGPSLFYIERCRTYKHTPPDGDWDGVVHLHQK